MDNRIHRPHKLNYGQIDLLLSFDLESDFTINVMTTAQVQLVDIIIAEANLYHGGEYWISDNEKMVLNIIRDKYIKWIESNNVLDMIDF